MKKPAEKPNTVKKAVSRRFTTAEVEKNLETYIIIPPDGGWGWVIVFVAFISNFVADGTMYTFGIFIEDISETIAGTTPETIAITNSFMTGCYYLTAPIISALTNRFGYRVVAMTGGFMAASVHLLLSYHTTLMITYFVYGTFGGMGFGMMYVPTLIAISYYFEKWRALTSSIAATGSAIGIIAFPIIFKVVLKHQPWQENFRVISCIIFVIACLCVLYRELEPVRVVSEDAKVHFQDEEMALKASVSKYHNVAFPTSANAYGKKDVAIVQPSAHPTNLGSELRRPTALKSKSNFRLETASYQGKRIRTVLEEDEDDEENEDDDDYYYYNQRGRCRKCKMRCRRCLCCKCCLRCRKCCQRYCKCCQRCCKNCRCWACCSCCQRSPMSAPIRPMYRDDIFYGASLMKLPAYARSVHQVPAGSAVPENYAIDYYLSVTRMTTVKDVMETERCVCCPEAVKRTLATMMDMNLLKSPSFFVLVLSGFFSTLGMFTPFMFIADRAKSYGIPEETAVSLVTVLGIANTAGRILSGVASSLPNVNALAFSCVSITTCGLATLLSSLSTTVESQYAFAAVFASSIACLAALRSIIIVDMVGLEKLTNACGISLLFQGMACLGGVPISVYLKNATGTYEAPFYFSGGSIFFSGILLMFVSPVSKWEKRRSR